MSGTLSDALLICQISYLFLGTSKLDLFLWHIIIINVHFEELTSPAHLQPYTNPKPQHFATLTFLITLRRHFN